MLLNDTQQTPDCPPKLRVLYVTNYDGIMGGAAFAVCRLMLDMKKRYNVEPVLLTKKESYFSQLCRQNGIELIVQHYYAWSTEKNTFAEKVKGSIKKFLNMIYFRRKVLSRIKGQHFDIIHTNSSITDMGDTIAHKDSVPHVWHLRESGYYYYYYPDEYVRHKHARAAQNIVISRSNYDVYVNEHKLCSPANTRIIYDGVEISAPYEKRTPSPEHINFCMTGNFHHVKNQLMAVKACEKLKALTSSFTLHLIGKDTGDYAGNVKEFVRSHGLEDCVKIWGYRSDVGEILRDMDIGLTLSTREGFGFVTVEYMLNYMPVIGVDTGATPEIVIDGETGYICPLNDTDRLAELMHKFITHTELVPAMGIKGRERAVSLFSIERNTDEIYSLYQEILSR